MFVWTFCLQRPLQDRDITHSKQAPTTSLTFLFVCVFWHEASSNLLGLALVCPMSSRMPTKLRRANHIACWYWRLVLTIVYCVFFVIYSRILCFKLSIVESRGDEHLPTAGTERALPPSLLAVSDHILLVFKSAETCFFNVKLPLYSSREVRVMDVRYSSSSC